MIVDLFAGPGGWDEGLRLLGRADVVGLELDRDACATRSAAGHRTIRCDVAAYPAEVFAGRVEGLIASPPCTDWSTAGSKSGRAGKTGHLVDTVPRWVEATQPTWIACEQVPPALKVWREHAELYRSWGYHVWVGIVCAADYGVPQTRRRAILVAHCTAAVGPPFATHAKAPVPTIFGTPRPWVTMAQALGLTGHLRPGGGLGHGNGHRAPVALDSGPAPTVAFGKDAASWVLRPARTICGARSPRWQYPDRDGTHGHMAEGLRLTIEQALVLQGFPPYYPVAGTSKSSRFRQVGNAVPPPMAAAIVAPLLDPASSPAFAVA